jgi:hypothetical protein
VIVEIPVEIQVQGVVQVEFCIQEALVVGVVELVIKDDGLNGRERQIGHLMVFGAP